MYVTEVQENSPAAKAGLREHDKILQVNDTIISVLLTTATNTDLLVKKKLVAIIHVVLEKHETRKWLHLKSFFRRMTSFSITLKTSPFTN